MAFEIRDGVLIRYLPEDGGESAVTVPDGVTEIARNAFCDCRTLREIRLPEGLRVIRRSAFNSCFALREIHIPETVTEIEADAFYLCRSLSAVRLPMHLKHVGVNAFARTQWAQEYSGSCIVSGEWLLKYKGDAEYAVIPETVRFIADGAFANSGIRSVTFPPRLETIGERAFALCSRLEALRFPETLRQIGANAFYFCNHLNRIEFAGDVPQAGADAFLLHAKVHTISVRGRPFVPDCYYIERRWKDWLCFGVETVLSAGRNTFGHLDYVDPEKCRMALDFYRFHAVPQLRDAMKEGITAMWVSCMNAHRTDLLAQMADLPELFPQKEAERLLRLTIRYAEITGTLEPQMLIMRVMRAVSGEADDRMQL
ncbi:MAG: leucine-rich repeat protein [Oscillospiraceae bacterium]|nr:leucine-rich repeat protein [Oscillospiraceae bacterium]